MKIIEIYKQIKFKFHYSRGQHEITDLHDFFFERAPLEIHNDKFKRWENTNNITKRHKNAFATTFHNT